jgi:hypothetical protein
MAGQVIFFYVDTAWMLDDVIVVAEILQAQAGARIVIVTDNPDQYSGKLSAFEVYDHADLFRPMQDVTPIGPPGSKSGEKASARARFARRWRGAMLLLSAPFQVFGVFRRARYWRRMFAGVRAFIRTIAPDVIVVLEDNIQTLSRLFVEEGGRAGIPSVILPFTIPNPREAAQFYKNTRNHRADGLVGRIFTSVYPRWRHEFEGRQIVRLPVLRALAYEMLGYSTVAPWIVNRGPAAAILLDSEAMRSRYAELGFPPEQLCVIGEPAGEVLFAATAERRQRRERLCAAHGWRADRPLVVCGFPPDQYSHTHEQFEFATFDAVVRAWMGALADLGDRANVVVRPHPRLSPDILRAYETGTVKVSTVRTSELIPLADLYVASISATIRWAIACGIPVINYDMYRYRYGDFVKVPGVVHVESIDQFRVVLTRFLEDPPYRKDLERRQETVKAHWGMVDDQFARRLVELMEAVAGKDSSVIGRPQA